MILWYSLCYTICAQLRLLCRFLRPVQPLYMCHYVAKIQVWNFFFAILFSSSYLKRSPTAQNSVWLSRWYPNRTAAANTTFHWGAVNRGWPTLLRESQLRLWPLDQPATWRQRFCLLLILNLESLRATAEQLSRSFRCCTNIDFHLKKQKKNQYCGFLKEKKSKAMNWSATTLKAVRTVANDTSLLKKTILFFHENFFKKNQMFHSPSPPL